MPKTKEFWIRLIAGIVAGLSWVGLIAWKFIDKEVNLKYPVIVAIIISVFSIIAFFGNTLYSKFKQIREEEIPEPINSEKLKEVIEKEVEKMWNMLKIENPIIWVRSKTINKNIIYAVKLNLVYEIPIDKEKYEECIMVINANFSDEQPTIIKPNSSEKYIDKIMNDKSKSPLDEPEVEERTETDLEGGKEIKYKKTTPKKKTEKKEGDVV